MSDTRVRLLVISDRPQALPVLLWSLINQTHAAWECLVLDQGVGHSAAAARAVPDPRIRYQVVARVGDWGQTAKEWAARTLTAPSDVLAFPNDDAYYCPVFLERLVGAIEAGAALAYCDWVFDKPNYAPFVGKPRVGYIDVGGFVITRAAFDTVGGFADRGQTGDGQLVERVVAAGLPHTHVPGCFYVKN